MLPNAGWEEILGRRSTAVPVVVAAVDWAGGREAVDDTVVLRRADAKMVGRKEGRVVYVLGGC
jgi:hypothetical protein